MPLEISTLIQYLNAISATAVIIGVVFVVFQLRQNAKLIEASNRQIETANKQVEASIQQNKQQVILTTIDRFSNEDFDQKRKRVRDIVKKYQSNDWKEYFESEDDYLVRGFIALYDSTGYLGKKGIVDVKMIQEGMGYLVINEWDTLKPAVDHYRAMWNRDVYLNFKWLNDSVRELMKAEEMASTGS